MTKACAPCRARRSSASSCRPTICRSSTTHRWAGATPSSGAANIAAPRKPITAQASFFFDPTTTICIGAVFAQDEIPLTPDLKLTAGLKLEDNSYSGLDPMPNVRLAWQVTESDMIWAAASGAVRTPSKIDRELEAPGILLPSPNFGSEKLTAYELGYRGEPLPRLALSASLFYNVYDDLRSDQGTPVTVVPIILLNGVKGESYGIDLWAKYGLTDWWRLTGGVSWLHRDFRSKPGFLDFAQGQSEGQDPATMAQIRSNMNLFQDFEFDSALRGVGKVTQQSPNRPSRNSAWCPAISRPISGWAGMSRKKPNWLFPCSIFCMTGIWRRKTLPPMRRNMCRDPLS